MPPLTQDAIDSISRLEKPELVLAAIAALPPEQRRHNFLEFLAGRAETDRARYREAVGRLRESLQMEPGFHWAWFELARALHGAGEPHAAVRALQEFFQRDPGNLGDGHLETCERIADAAQAAGHGELAAPIYTHLVKSGANRYFPQLRALEAALDRQDVTEARRLRIAIGAPREVWGYLAFAWEAALRGEAGPARQQLRRAQEAMPDSFRVAARTIRVLRAMPLAEAAPLLKDFLAGWQAHFVLEDLAALHVCAGDALLQAAGATADLSLALESQYLPDAELTDYLYESAPRLVAQPGQAFLHEVARRFLDRPKVMECVANIFTAARCFDDARQLCRLAIETNGDPDQFFGFKLFEIECFANNLDEAQRLLASLGPMSFNAEQQLMVARLRAEQGRWEEAVGLLQPLVEGSGRPSPELVDLAVRAARKAGAQNALLAALAGQRSPEADRFATALLEDLAVKPRGAAAAGRLVKAGGLAVPDMLAFKLEVASGRAAARPRARRAIFYCADRGYVLPALVSLVSLLQTNPSLQAADFFLVVDDDLVDDLGDIMEALGEHYGVRLKGVAASATGADVSLLNARYGIFTGGHQLAHSAYFRIYMARKLAETKRYSEVLYLDSDTLVREGFHKIFEGGRRPGALLVARPEVDRPEIRRAESGHGLPPGSYFNSGVLYFPDLGAEAIGRLQEAQRLAEEEPQRLVFQDQCALNLSFAGVTVPLPQDFNFFVTPKDAPAFESLPFGLPKLVHTLDRPKPWDSLYPPGTAVQGLWLNAVRKLRRVIGEDGTKRLFGWTFSA